MRDPSRTNGLLLEQGAFRMNLQPAEAGGLRSPGPPRLEAASVPRSLSVAPPNRGERTLGLTERLSDDRPGGCPHQDRWDRWVALSCGIQPLPKGEGDCCQICDWVEW